MERFGLKSEMPKIGKKAMEKMGIEYGGDEEQGRPEVQLENRMMVERDGLEGLRFTKMTNTTSFPKMVM